MSIQFNPHKSCMACYRNVFRFQSGSRGRASIEACIENCETLLDEVSPIALNAVRIYSAIANQLNIGGMGTILGIHHSAIHSYLQMCGFYGLEYRVLFSKVLELDGIARQMREKYSGVGSGAGRGLSAGGSRYGSGQGITKINGVPTSGTPSFQNNSDSTNYSPSLQSKVIPFHVNITERNRK